MGNNASTVQKQLDSINGRRISVEGAVFNTTTNMSQRLSMSRSASGTEISDKNVTHFVPAEKLAKILHQKTQDEYGINGIVSDSFVKHVFPQYPDLGNRLFSYLHQMSKAQTVHISSIAFRQQCERFLSILDDSVVLENYIKMFCERSQPDLVTPDGLRGLLTICFELAMAHYSDGAHKYCPLIDRTLNSVLASCFFSKESLSSGFVSRWLEQNCPRIVPPVHRFVLHTLSTAYRGIDGTDAGINLELATPVLNNANPFDERHPPLMPVSQAWLLASALPTLYVKPQPISQSTANSVTNSTTGIAQSSGVMGSNGSGGGGGGSGMGGLASTMFLMKMLSVVPSHWTLLYDSNQHGVGSNRFLHHVLGYKGPTLCMFRSADAQVFCVASPTEWRESHLYTGEKDSCLIQILPKFSVIESKPKILYLNTCMRGYPKGLKAGSDPRKPLLSVDEHFEKVEIRGIPFILDSIEVWGCGDKYSRDVQLDIKKWQVKEAERQRTVKLTAADWLDNPDRYLLELGGRPQYNNA